MDCFLDFSYKISKHQFFLSFSSDPGPYPGLLHSKFGYAISPE